MEEKTLYILDGHALVFRAHYAFINRPLMNSKGMNTSAITGFVRSLWDILINHQPSHIAVSFDKSDVTFRNELYPDYKAHRDKTPEDIQIALPIIKEIVKAFNIPIVELDNYEADDVIGTLAKQAEEKDFNVFMVTPDKDFGQLVTDKIKIYRPSRRGNGAEVLGIKEVTETWDIDHVDQVIDMIGLQGDSADNIPGIPGIGPKTASMLLKQYGTIENLLENVEELKGKRKENVIKYAEQGLLSKKLAIIDTNAPIELDLEETKVVEANKEKLAEIFAELEFRTLADSILGATPQKSEGVQQTLFPQTASSGSSAVINQIAPKDFKNSDKDYRMISTDEEITSLTAHLKNASRIALDTETTSLYPTEAEIVGISFSILPDEAFYIPLPVKKEECIRILNMFKDVLENENIIKVGQNIKYDMIVLMNYGIRLGGTFHDTMLFHYLLQPELRHSLDYLAETYLSYQMISYDELTEKKGRKQKKLREVDPEKMKNYAAEDSDITLQLHDILVEELKKEKLEELYYSIEEPLIEVLADMEFQGIHVDSDFLNQYSKELNQEVIALEEKIQELAGCVFNISSPKQVGEVLFDQLKLPYRWRKTKTGQYSTDEAKLSELAVEHDIAKMILDYRGLTKLKSTYVDALPKMINPHTGRIHSSFNQALTSTGRLSSNHPNLQNIPIRTEAGQKVRKAFIPGSKDQVLLSADYSQIELRLLAHMSGDEAMLEAFNDGKDIHRATAARVYEVDYDDVTPDQRRNAKTVNFSIIYGAGATNLSRQLNIPRTEATELIEAYFRQYQGLKRYMDKTVDEAREKGYVKTLLGRKRFLRDINSRSRMARSAAERIAVNTPVQGTAADMIKLAMSSIYKRMKKENLKSKMILQVHDELMFDVWTPELEALEKLVKEEMEKALPGLKVPIIVETGTGQNWLEAH